MHIPTVTEICKLHPTNVFKDSPPSPFTALGTAAHYHILKEYAPIAPPEQNGTVCLPADLSLQMLMRAVNRWRGVMLEGTPIGAEMSFNTELGGYRFRGKADLVTQNNTNNIIYEIKTGGFHEFYRLQAAAYCHGFCAQKAHIVCLNAFSKRSSCVDVITLERGELEDALCEFYDLLVEYYETNNV